jgi:hypothetical protein
MTRARIGCGSDARGTYAGYRSPRRCRARRPEAPLAMAWRRRRALCQQGLSMEMLRRRGGAGHGCDATLGRASPDACPDTRVATSDVNRQLPIDIEVCGCGQGGHAARVRDATCRWPRRSSTRSDRRPGRWPCHRWQPLTKMSGVAAEQGCDIPADTCHGCRTRAAAWAPSRRRWPPLARHRPRPWEQADHRPGGRGRVLRAMDVSEGCGPGVHPLA